MRPSGAPRANVVLVVEGRRPGGAVCGGGLRPRHRSLPQHATWTGVHPARRPSRRVSAGGAAAKAMALESAVSLAEGDSDPMLLAWLAHAKAVTGHRRDAAALITRARALERERYVPPYHLAMAYLAVKEIDTAFELLDQAWLDRDPAIAGVNVEPRFEPLRGGSAL